MVYFIERIAEMVQIQGFLLFQNFYDLLLDIIIKQQISNK